MRKTNESDIFRIGNINGLNRNSKGCKSVKKTKLRQEGLTWHEKEEEEILLPGKTLYDEDANDVNGLFWTESKSEDKFAHWKRWKWSQ
ncbi:hypothetical protein M0802_008975 [Mischocyttarus mexicanus]|nr:hypothetical protein M0802_008975 [Mischocyttarus mexicanus]